MESLDSFLTPHEMQQKLADLARTARLAENHSRPTAAELTGVAASTIKHFERTGEISLRHFLMLCRTYGKLGAAVDLFPEKVALTMDELLATPKDRRRGRQ